MKFWQLTALLKARPDSIVDASQSRPEWKKFGAWLAALNELCDAQDREKLDEELPDDFVRAVLSTVDIPFYVTGDGWIHLGRHHDTVECLSALDAFIRFGGEVLEDALEKGCSHRKLFQPRP